MDIELIKKKTARLESEITKLINNYQKETTCNVTDISFIESADIRSAVSFKQCQVNVELRFSRR